MLIQMHVPTMFTMIILASVSLALSVGWVSWRSSEDGLRSWAGALCVHAVSYCLLSGRGAIPDVFSIILANTLIALAYALLLLAVQQFQSRPIGRLTLWLPAAIIALSFPFMMGDVLQRVLLANAVFLTQALLVCRQLLAYRYDFPVRGRNLVIFGLVIGMATEASRIAVTFANPGQLAGPLEPSGIQTVTYSAVFVSIILISNGFVMMAKERSDERLKRVAMKDRLTDCWNRIRIEEVGQQEMARLRRYGYPVSLILIDLDHFKTVNDRYGHFAGDDILKGFADIARASIRATDVLGRWGGEEFVVILPSSGFPEAVHIAERIRSGLERHVFPGGHTITASLGIAVCLSTDDWETWLGRADRALYQAKTDGRNRSHAEGLAIGDDYRLEPTAQILELSWRSGYDSGCDPLDAEHRSLFIEANRLLRLGSEGDRKEEIFDLAQSLLTDSRSHFVNEENLLEQQGFGGLVQHRSIHRHLLERFEMMLDRYRQDRIGPAELLHFVAYELIAQHMLIEDVRYYSLFRADGV